MHQVYYNSNTNSTIWPPPLPAGPGNYDNQDHPERNDDYYLDSDDEPSIILKVGAWIWLLLILFCFKRQRELEMESEARSARRRARRDERRQIREALERRLDPKRRCKDVEAAIRTVSYTEHDAQRCHLIEDADVKQPPRTARVDANMNAKTNTTSEFEDERTCSICLDQFAVGSELSWSRDLYCRHVFHKECLTPWLMKHDDCPVCRTDLIIDHDAVKIKSGDDTTRTDNDDDVEPSRLGTFQIVNGLVSYVRQTSLSMLHHRSEEEEEQEAHSAATIDETIPQVGTRIASDEEHGERQEEAVTNDGEGNDADADLTRTRAPNNRRRYNRYRSVASDEMDSTRSSEGLVVGQIGSSDEEMGIEYPRQNKLKVGRQKYQPISSTGGDDECVDDNEQNIDDRFVIAESDD